MGRDAGLTLGVVTDAHHADRDELRGRRYRDALARIDEAVDAFDAAGVDLVVQLGDLVDGHPDDPDAHRRDLATAREHVERARAPVAHVLGNHDLAQPRETTLPALGLDRTYRSFVHGRWRVVLLDGLGEGVVGWTHGTPQRMASDLRLVELAYEHAPNAEGWNGGVDTEQLAWLVDELRAAEAAGERVAVLHHLPIVASAARARFLSWSHAELSAALMAAPCAALHVAGHDHRGGHARVDGVHHLTLRGMVAAPIGSNAFAVLELGKDAVVVRGSGVEPSRRLEI